MTRGLVVGKFLPPHLGHSYLIRSAQDGCDQLTVLICDRPEYAIPAGLRKEWLEIQFPGVSFKIIQDKLDDNDSAGWAKNTIRVLGFAPDVVFSSESYGPDYASYLGASHRFVDLDRNTFPVSGTAVREDPFAQWQYLHPVVRAYLARRICLVGSESSGTSTLARQLAAHYKATWVEEYGRTYTIDNKERLDKRGWHTKDFVIIAAEQNRLEDEAAKAADKLLFCDTDSFATSIWHERYMGTRSAAVEALAVNRPYSLYLLTDTAIPFEQDGYRDGEELRGWMQERFEEKLRFWDKPYVLITGTKQERLKQAVSLIDTIINNSAINLPGLIRNSWHPKGGF